MQALQFVVVKNHEEQYSIWMADKAVPAGWIVQGEPASKEECLEFIRLNWTDLTPLSARREPLV